MRVFVSYSRRNKTFAERLARDLADAGLDIWIDFRQIHAGEMWQEEIYRGIERSEVIVVCLSPDAVTSEWVQREVNAGREKNKVILPVMAINALDALQATDTMRWLLDVHFINFEQRYEEGFPELLSALPGKRRVNTYDDIDPENIPNPFKGLEAFQQTDASFFFGREALIDKSLDRLREDRPIRFLAVVGASGSGKSSMVRAGVIPRIRSNALPDSDQWRIAIFTPGGNPVESLAQRISPLIEDRDTAAVRELLNESPENITPLINHALADSGDRARLLLVVDQFEEVFTRAGEIERQHFIDALHHVVTRPGGRAIVLITMRADFFDRLSHYQKLAELFEQENMVIVTEMSPTELLRTIEGPAQAVGLTYDRGLPQRILEEVRRQPGSLPLLQYALKELYLRRDGARLTTRAYEAIGGVRQALAQHAETIYVSMTAAQQAIMRRVLLRLIEVNENGEATRRKVRRDELTFRELDASAVQEVIDLLTAAESRLLIASREIASQDAAAAPTLWIEVSHEALIREWDRFTGWVAENVENLRYGTEIMQAAHDWENSAHDAAYLLTGNRLVRSQVWMDTADETDLQREFIEASIKEDERQKALNQQQAERELQLQQRATTRLRLFVAVLVIGLIVAVALSGVALNSLDRANTEATRAANALNAAERSEEEALSLALSASANRSLGDGDSELAVLLGVSANQIANPPAQSQRTLAEVAYAPGTRTLFDLGDESGRDAVFSASGQTIISAVGGDVLLWNAADGELISRFGGEDGGHTDAVNSVAISPDGQIAASGGGDSLVILWNTETGDEVARLEAHTSDVNVVAFSPADAYGVSAGRDDIAILWSSETGEEIRRFEGHEGAINDAAFSPDGSLLITAADDETARIWAVSTGQLAAVLAQAEDIAADALAAAFSPTDLQEVAVSYENGTVVIWDFVDLREVLTFTDHTEGVDVNDVGYSPNGDRIVSASEDEQIIIWNAFDGGPTGEFEEHEGAVNSAAFSPDGEHILSSSADGSLRLWDINRSEEIRQLSGHEKDRTVVGEYGANDTRVLSGSWDGTVRLWDAASGLTIQQFLGHTGRVLDVDLSDDGQRVLSASTDSDVILWDAVSGQEIRRYSDHTENVQTVRFLSDEQRIVSGAADGRIIVWNIETAEVVNDFAPAAGKDDVGHLAAVNDIAAHPNGQYILSASGDGALILWDLESGEALQQFEDHNSPVRTVAFSADGSRAVSGASDGVVLVWDFVAQSPLTGSINRRIEGHDRAVIDASFSADGASFVTTSLDSTLRLWDATTGFELRRYTPLDNVVFRSAEFNGDGRLVLTGMADGSLREWRMLTELDELLAWTFANRFVPEATCADRVTFSLTPGCDEDGVAPTSTPFPLPTPTVTPDAPRLEIGGEAIVNTDDQEGLRLRADTDVHAEIIETLADGEIVTLIGGPISAGGYRWWNIRTASEHEGWSVESVPEDGIRTLLPR